MDPLLAKALFGGAVVVAGAGTWLGLGLHARSALNAHLRVHPNPAPLGGGARFQVQLRPRSEVRVNRVLARTRCLRRVAERRGGIYEVLRAETLPEAVLVLLFKPKGDRIFGRVHVEEDEVATSEVELSGPATWAARQLVTWEVEVPLADGLPTDTEGSLTIRWVAEVHFDIPAFPDVTLRQPFRVVRVSRGWGTGSPKGGPWSSSPS